MKARLENLKTLGLPPSASPEEIRGAYRDLAQVWHPDRFAHSPALQHKAEAKMKEINEAYDALKGSVAETEAWQAEPERRRAPSAPAPRAESAPERRAPIKPAGSGLALWTLLALIAAGGWLAYQYHRVRPASGGGNEPLIAGLNRPGNASGKRGFVGRGASQAKVLAALGAPDSKERLGALEVWRYGRSAVVFSDGAVTGWQNAGDFVLVSSAAKP